MRIPGYRIEKRIGEGGAATVYLAIQESLDRPVALKILNTVLTDDPAYSKRFLNEGRIIAALVHQNIITIHDVGVADGVHYITMEHVAGGDLNARMRERVAPDEALRLVRALASALDFAHRAGVVHRDVKPANVLFRPDGTALLTDFGIAKRLQDDVTLGGIVLGTPGYLSPEQSRGEKIDARCDVYALGVVLYEMLAGKRAFRADTEIATILLQLEGPVPRLPGALARYQPLVDRMTAPDRADRLPDMGSVLAEVDALTGRAAPARSARRGLVAAGLGAAIALAGAGGAWLHLRGGAGPSAPSEAPSAPAVAAEPAPPVAEVASVPVPAPDPAVTRVGQLNALGREALAAGRLAAPGEDSALVYFQGALELDPANAEARAGIGEIVSRYTDAAEGALADRRFSVAKRRAALGLRARPGDARLTAIEREAGARGAQIATLLVAAERALEDYRLTTPDGDNALHYFEAVLEIEPRNARAADGKKRIVAVYAELAEDRIARYQYGDARELIRRGLQVRPGDRRLLALRGRADVKRAPGQLVEDIKGLFD